jgi:predicted nucleic acid-binding protein
MLIIDTSIYISAFKKDDSQHLDAVVFLESCTDTIVLTQIVLQETLTVLTYKHTLEAAHIFLDFVNNDPRFVLVETNLMQEIAFWHSLSKRISIIDASVIYTAHSYQIPLETFDLEMKQIYTSLLSHNS